MALAPLALVVFGAYDSYPNRTTENNPKRKKLTFIGDLPVIHETPFAAVCNGHSGEITVPKSHSGPVAAANRPESIMN